MHVFMHICNCHIGTPYERQMVQWCSRKNVLVQVIQVYYTYYENDARGAKEEAFGSEIQCRIIVFTTRHSLMMMTIQSVLSKVSEVFGGVARLALLCTPVRSQTSYTSLVFCLLWLTCAASFCELRTSWRQAICFLQTHNHKLCKYFAKKSI